VQAAVLSVGGRARVKTMSDGYDGADTTLRKGNCSVMMCC
jgi:hypothetical protein